MDDLGELQSRYFFFFGALCASAAVRAELIAGRRFHVGKTACRPPYRGKDGWFLPQMFLRRVAAQTLATVHFSPGLVLATRGAEKVSGWSSLALPAASFESLLDGSRFGSVRLK